MKTYRASASSVIDVPTTVVYEIISDYANLHGLILPSPPFLELHVETGGVGAGTVIGFSMRAFGKTQTFRAAVAEPEPGHILTETNLEGAPLTTKFILNDLDSGRATRITIITDGTTNAGGLAGSVEAVLSKLFLERTYRKELMLLNNVALRRSR